MSRIGRKPIQIPQGVDVTIGDTSVMIKGPKGTLSVALHPHVKAVLSPERVLTVEIGNTEDMGDRALWGLFRKLLSNAVDGVQKPFEVKLEFIGVGYRVSVAGNKVVMEVGFSHPIEYQLPEGVSAVVEKNALTLTGIDKQLVGETAARIRRIRPPEPYKGKGIKYSDEVIRRKAGKAAKTGS
jgi:large subunit ribosomal protein L6